jgi:fructose-bisphosphate aldolase class I
VQLMKPMPGLDALLARAVKAGIFGTKERSVINAANRQGIAAIVAQQFEIGRQVAAHGLMPILEPEVTISIADKAQAEAILQEEILKALEGFEGQVMLKLSLPTIPDFYAPLVKHPKVLKVVALSGGYSRDEANRILAQNHGIIASFSRALSEGLSAKQTDGEFDAVLKGAIDSIHAASIT